MAKGLKPVDVSQMPELVHIAEEVQAANQPLLLKRGSQELAIVIPVRPSGRRRAPHVMTEEDYEAFQSAAGAWQDVDTDKLIAEIYESRERSSRAPVEL